MIWKPPDSLGSPGVTDMNSMPDWSARSWICTSRLGTWLDCGHHLGQLHEPRLVLLAFGAGGLGLGELGLGRGQLVCLRRDGVVGRRRCPPGAER